MNEGWNEVWLDECVVCPQDAEPVVTEDIPLDTQTIVDMITPSGGELAGSSDAIKEPGRKGWDSRVDG